MRVDTLVTLAAQFGVAVDTTFAANACWREFYTLVRTGISASIRTVARQSLPSPFDARLETAPNLSQPSAPRAASLCDRTRYHTKPS